MVGWNGAHRRVGRPVCTPIPSVFAGTVEGQDCHVIALREEAGNRVLPLGMQALPPSVADGSGRGT